MPTLHRLEIDGQDLFALEYNPDRGGIPVLYIHGIASSIYFWEGGESLTPLLKERHWFSLTLPGHHPARFGPGFRETDLTAENISAWLSKAVRKLVGDQPVMMIGHSTGGFAALTMAAQNPGIANAVISMNGFVQGRWGGILRPLQVLARTGAVGRAMFKMNMTVSSLTPAIYHQVTGFYSSDRRAYFAFPGLRDATRRLQAEARQLDLDKLAVYFSRMPDIDIESWLPRIQVPVLALTGAADRIVPPEQTRKIAAGVPNGTLHALAGAGHMPFAERPQDYARIMNDWLLRYSGPQQ